MRLGLGPIALGDVSREELESLAHAAVAASFDAVWVAEDRARGVGGGLAAAAMLGRVVPLRVGAVVDVGTYHPLHLAEDIAVADISTGGRLEVLFRPAARPEVFAEAVEVVARALSGAHLRWEGEELKIPARLDANEPVPARLAVNPHALQPVIPVWLMDQPRAGFGLARRWASGIQLGGLRVPDLVLCPNDVAADDLVSAAGDHPGYFMVDASSPDDVRSTGRRLVGPLRMPGFPAWINQQ